MSSMWRTFKRRVNQRRTLSANKTLYVRTDGSDNNHGLIDSAASAFATWQAAINAALAYDTNGFVVTVQAGEEGSAKVWTSGQITIGPITGGGALSLQPSTSGTSLVGTNGLFILSETLGKVFCGGLTLSSSVNTYGTVEVTGKSTWIHDTVGPNYGASAGADIWVHDNQAAAWLLNSSYRLVAGARTYHYVAANRGHIFDENNTVTIAAAIVLNVYALAQGGSIQATANTFVNPGNITGNKFSVQLGGFINTQGGGINYYPGNFAGTYGTLGLYADIYPTTAYTFPAGIRAEGSVALAYADPVFALAKNASGHTNYLTGTTAGVNRWLEALGDSTAESGSNVGSDWSLSACDDAGSLIGRVVRATRSTRQLTIDGCYGTTVPTPMTAATYTLLDTDNYLIANRAGTVTITLPSATTYQGRVITVKTIQAQTVVASANVVVPLIGGAAAAAILAATAGKWATLISNGTTWDIMAAN